MAIWTSKVLGPAAIRGAILRAQAAAGSVEDVPGVDIFQKTRNKLYRAVKSGKMRRNRSWFNGVMQSLIKSAVFSALSFAGGYTLGKILTNTTSWYVRAGAKVQALRESVAAISSFPGTLITSIIAGQNDGLGKIIQNFGVVSSFFGGVASGTVILKDSASKIVSDVIENRVGGPAWEKAQAKLLLKKWLPAYKAALPSQNRRKKAIWKIVRRALTGRDLVAPS